MKLGDVIIDNNDRKWLVFSTSQDFIYVVDYETQKYGEILLNEYVKEIIEIPENVKSMFLKRRLNNYKDMEKYL